MGMYLCLITNDAHASLHKILNRICVCTCMRYIAYWCTCWKQCNIYMHRCAWIYILIFSIPETIYVQRIEQTFMKKINYSFWIPSPEIISSCFDKSLSPVDKRLFDKSFQAWQFTFQKHRVFSKWRTLRSK